VILATAHGLERLAVRAVFTGAYEYVTKHFDLAELGVALERALEARRPRPSRRSFFARRRRARSSRWAPTKSLPEYEVLLKRASNHYLEVKSGAAEFRLVALPADDLLAPGGYRLAPIGAPCCRSSRSAAKRPLCTRS